MNGNVTALRDENYEQAGGTILDDVLISVGLPLERIPFAEIGTSHEVLVSKLERIVRKACKNALLDREVAGAFPHTCDMIFDEAVKSIASDIAKALVYDRRSEAEALLSTAAMDALTTETEIRSFAI